MTRGGFACVKYWYVNLNAKLHEQRFLQSQQTKN